MTDTHHIYLAGLDYGADGYQTSAINGVRSIWNSFGFEHTFGDARKLVDTFQSEPTEKLLVWESSDAAACEEAIVEAAEAHQGAALFELNPSDLTLPHPGEEETAGFNDRTVALCLILMSMCEGDPTVAYIRCAQLANITGDDLYEVVQELLLEVFPIIPQGPGLDIFKS